jgi:hypothetical protein
MKKPSKGAKVTKRKRDDKLAEHGDASIPAEADWGDYEADLDQRWAHGQYCGRSNEQMQRYVRNSPIEAASDLQFMPEVPFRYYMIGYRDLVMSGEFENHDASSAASCFLNLVSQKLEEQPRYIVPIMPELISAVEYVAHHQADFGAEEKFYGNFLEKLERIQSLYEECRDRYRRYP